ncbi:MAG: GGDEF domain-containing protein [Desulfohalobiaceae bacterium]
MLTDQDLFSREYRIIEEAEQVLQSRDFADNPLYSHYCDLLDAYKKLFKQTRRLVKMGDRMQNDLSELNTELHKHKEKLSQMSYVDGLTSIFNRRRFNEYLEAEWQRAVRSEQPLSLIILDIDFFKQFNDHYGHSAGDDCLVLVAQTLSSCVKRSSDLVSRFGGEEFAVVLPETDFSAAMGLAENIRASICELGIVHGYSQVASYVTVSTGVACAVPAEKDKYMELLEAADRQLYAAKEAGRNQVQGQEGLGQG